MNAESKQALLSAVRSLLITAGSVLVTKGYVDDATLQAIIGAIMVLVPVLWGIWDKYQSEASAKAREVTAVNAGITLSNQSSEYTQPVSSTAEAKAVIQQYQAP